MGGWGGLTGDDGLGPKAPSIESFGDLEVPCWKHTLYDSRYRHDLNILMFCMNYEVLCSLLSDLHGTIHGSVVHL